MTQPEIRLSAPVGAAGRPLVVLGHSLGTEPLIWERVLPALAAEYRVSLLTLPGHGDAAVPTAPFSLAELADAVVDAARSDAGGPLLYAGVSIGGALGLELALHHPEAIAGAAILASGAQLGSTEHWTQRAALVREQSTSALVAGSAKSWFAPDSIANEPELTGRILRVLQNTSDEGYARCAEALAGYDVRARLPEIDPPILAAFGEFDTIGTELKQDEIVAGVRRGSKTCIEGAAHQPPAEQPDRTARALLEFFAECAR